MSAKPPTKEGIQRMAEKYAGEASAQTKKRVVEATYDFKLGCEIVQHHTKEDAQDFFNMGRVDGGMVWSNIPYEMAVILEGKLLAILNELHELGQTIGGAVREARPPL